MRFAAFMVLGSILLTGCAPADKQSRTDESAIGSVVSSIGVDVPEDDASLSPFDSGGVQPGEAVLALIAAVNAADWDAAYSLYAAPEVDLATAARQWGEADERYEDFSVHETRVIGTANALVRVTYRARTTPPGGDPYEVVVEAPGEWWQVEMIDDQWRVQWLPRQ